MVCDGDEGAVMVMAVMMKGSAERERERDPVQPSTHSLSSAGITSRRNSRSSFEILYKHRQRKWKGWGRGKKLPFLCVYSCQAAQSFRFRSNQFHDRYKSTHIYLYLPAYYIATNSKLTNPLSERKYEEYSIHSYAMMQSNTHSETQ